MRVAIAEDSLLFREGLARILEELDFEVVSQSSTGDELVDQVGDLNLDLAVVDIRMPPTFTTEGIAAAAAIGQKAPEVGVVVLSHYIESDYALQLLTERAAGRGYLLKDRVGDLDAFADALRRVAHGGSVVDPAVIAALVDRHPAAIEVAHLTARELEILTLMAEGLSNNGICDRLTLSRRTVESHIRTIFQKFELDEDEDQNRRVVAVLKFLREGS